MSLLTFRRSLVSAPSLPPARLRVVFLFALAVVVVLMSAKYAVKVSKPGDTGELTRSASRSRETSRIAEAATIGEE